MKVDECPAVRYITLGDDMFKYRPESPYLTASYITQFVTDVRGGKVKPHLFSEEIPAYWASKPVAGEEEKPMDLLDELENEEIPHSIREARLSQLKMPQEFSQMNYRDHGKFTDILEEKSFLELTTSVDRCVVHFYHPDFRRCSIMDNHLTSLSEKHFETKFVKISAEKPKFVVNKLKIHVLPAVLCFVKGIIIVDRIVGFDDLGNSDEFPTAVLEQRLLSSGVIGGELKTQPANSTIGLLGRGANNLVNDNESSDDDD